MKTIKQLKKDNQVNDYLIDNGLYDIDALIIKASKQAFEAGYELGYDTYTYSLIKETKQYLKEIEE